MGAVGMLARSELRRRWRSVVVLTLLVGVAGAVVLALVAGARRTDSSLSRFEQESRAADLEINVGDVTDAQLQQFRHSPGVAAVGLLYQLPLMLPDGRFPPTAAQLDRSFGTEIDRARLVKGRLASLDSVDEVDIGEGMASLLHIGVGDHLTFQSFSPDDVSHPSSTVALHGPRITLRVVGIVRRPLDLGGRGAAGGVVVTTPTFFAKYKDQIGTFAGTILRVRTKHGSADADQVVHEARRIFGSAPQFGTTSLAVEGAGARNAIDVTTVGLALAAAVAALTAVVAIALALSREISLADTDQVTLSALGLRWRRRVLATALIGFPPALVGAAIAMIGATLASPLFPIGVAAQAETDPGLRFDPLAVVGGGLLLALVVLAISLVAGARTAGITRARARRARPGVAARVTEQTGAPPPAAAGVRFALDPGRQRRPLPVRSSLLGATAGVLVVVAVLVFSAGLHRLVTTPARYGWNWDFVGYDAKASTTGGGDCDPLHTALARRAEFTAVASVCEGDIQVAGHPTTSWGYASLRGVLHPEIVEGRAPATSTEVALGADTLAATHRHVGDRVRVEGTSGTRVYRIVGQTVIAAMEDPAPLADGAAFTRAGLARVGADGGWDIVVRLAPGADRAAIAREFRRAAIFGSAVGPALPAEIDRVRQIRDLPTLLAVFVAVVALTAVGLGLVTSLRRRRRDLAVLKTLGFSRRQLRVAVAWQASTVAAVALVVGIPLGALVGTYFWRRVADELGVASDPAWPVLALVIVAAVALIAVNVVAAFPARRAARTRPAVVLRSE
jgi:hypothetical protein